MKLTMRQVASMFDAPEQTIERWIKNDNLPCHRVHGQARFHRAELLEWAHDRGIRLVSDPPVSLRPGARPGLVVNALAAGGVHHDVPAEDRESLLRAMVDRMPLGAEVDRELLFEVLLAQERSGSTGVGDGIAIPHVRSPVVLETDRPTITLCFLRKPIDFGAIDGKPVHTVFTIVSPTIRLHLLLLARLAAVLHEEGFRRALLDRVPADQVLASAGLAEERFVRGSLNGEVNVADATDDEDATP
jgi:PTS system nitrogen regulatory IIA component